MTSADIDKNDPHSLKRHLFLGGALFLFALLLFVRLGHYALWDDEAATALAAKGVLRTGDTSVLLDHGNICAYRNGLDIRGFADHSMPPLDAYLTSLSFLLFGINAWAARLPFAFLGLLTLALLLFWARQANRTFLIVFTLGLLGNVSLLLFFRQCRYYAPALFFSCAIVFIYWQVKPTVRNLLVLAGLSVLLFLSNYLDYLALYLGLAVDYAFWKRKEWPFSWRNIFLLLGPQILVNGLAAAIWNPFLTPHGAYLAVNGLLEDRLTLFWWYWRDQNRCEFFALPILLLALGLGLLRRRPWLVRGCVAMASYVAVIVCLSPQPVHFTSVADVRYAAPLIPLAIALEADVLCLLLERRARLAIGAAVIVFGTNLFNGGPLLYCGLRSAFVCYAMELVRPPSEPYTPAARWIDDHIPAGDSIWVLPDYATYPLMFHAPQALYAWQLDWPPRPDFALLPLIHFKGQQPPDYIMAFGPAIQEMAQARQGWDRSGVHYRQVATIPVFWKDLYRPELFWHTFNTVTPVDLESEAIAIFQRTDSKQRP